MADMHVTKVGIISLASCTTENCRQDEYDAYPFIALAFLLGFIAFIVCWLIPKSTVLLILNMLLTSPIYQSQIAVVDIIKIAFAISFQQYAIICIVFAKPKSCLIHITRIRTNPHSHLGYSQALLA